MTHFVGMRRFDGALSFGVQSYAPRENRTKEQKEATAVCIELNEAGAALSLDALIAAYHKNGLKEYKAPEKPKLDPPGEKRDRSWSGHRIGVKHSPESLAANAVGNTIKIFKEIFGY